MKESSRGRRYRKIISIMMMLLGGLVFTWFAVVRISSPLTVVKTFTLSQEQMNLKAPVKSLRVGCYNIAHGRGGKLGTKNWEGGSQADKIARLKQIGQLLDIAKLDIVVLNEVDFSSVWSGHIDQAKIIAEEAGFPFVLEQRNLNMSIPFAGLQFGNVVLSKYPIIDVSFLDYPNPSEVIEWITGGYKEGVVATIKLSDTDAIRVAAVHLCVNNESIRKESVSMLLDEQRKSSLPFLLMGDFNSGYLSSGEQEDPHGAIDVLLASKKLSTIQPEFPISPNLYTFPTESPDRIIDWIFVSREWQMKDLQVMQTSLSDHLPVIAVLTQ